MRHQPPGDLPITGGLLYKDNIKDEVRSFGPPSDRLHISTASLYLLSREQDVPASIAQILDDLALPRLDPDQVEQSLELAALLGSSADIEEWRCACEQCGIAAAEELVDPLAEQGVITVEGDRWAFADPAVRRELIARAERHQRAHSHHTACARALLILYPDGRSGVDGRRAEHLRKAGRFDEALNPLLRAVKESIDRGDFEAAGELLDVHEDLLDELGVGEDEPRRAQNQWRRAKLLQIVGDRTGVAALVEHSRRVLDQTDWASERGHAALLHGRILRDAGQFEDARSCFDQAASHYGSAGDEHGLATSRASRGLLELRVGQHQLARRILKRALASFEELGDSYMVASLLNFIGQTWLIDGEDAAALDCVQRARQVARRAGHQPNEAATLIALGEIARRAADWQQARRCYSAAAELYAASENRSLYIARYNVALVEIGAQNFGQARALLEELEQQYPRVGFSGRLPLIYVGLMACAAGEADWAAFDDHHARTVEAIEEFEVSHMDIVWVARQAMRLADVGENTPARRAACELACTQLEGLGHQERADQLRASLDADLPRD